MQNLKSFHQQAQAQQVDTVTQDLKPVAKAAETQPLWARQEKFSVKEIVNHLTKGHSNDVSRNLLQNMVRKVADDSSSIFVSKHLGKKETTLQNELKIMFGSLETSEDNVSLSTESKIAGLQQKAQTKLSAKPSPLASSTKKPEDETEAEDGLRNSILSEKPDTRSHIKQLQQQTVFAKQEGKKEAETNNPANEPDKPEHQEQHKAAVIEQETHKDRLTTLRQTTQKEQTHFEQKKTEIHEQQRIGTPQTHTAVQQKLSESRPKETNNKPSEVQENESQPKNNEPATTTKSNNVSTQPKEDQPKQQLNTNQQPITQQKSEKTESKQPELVSETSFEPLEKSTEQLPDLPEKPNTSTNEKQTTTQKETNGFKSNESQPTQPDITQGKIKLNGIIHELQNTPAAYQNDFLKSRLKTLVTDQEVKPETKTDSTIDSPIEQTIMMQETVTPQLTGKPVKGSRLNEATKEIRHNNTDKDESVDSNELDSPESPTTRQGARTSESAETHHSQKVQTKQNNKNESVKETQQKTTKNHHEIQHKAITHEHAKHKERLSTLHQLTKKEQIHHEQKKANFHEEQRTGIKQTLINKPQESQNIKQNTSRQHIQETDNAENTLSLTENESSSTQAKGNNVRDRNEQGQRDPKHIANEPTIKQHNTLQAKLNQEEMIESPQKSIQHEFSDFIHELENNQAAYQNDYLRSKIKELKNQQPANAVQEASQPKQQPKNSLSDTLSTKEKNERHIRESSTSDHSEADIKGLASIKTVERSGQQEQGTGDQRGNQQSHQNETKQDATAKGDAINHYLATYETAVRNGNTRTTKLIQLEEKMVKAGTLTSRQMNDLQLAAKKAIRADIEKNISDAVLQRQLTKGTRLENLQAESALNMIVNKTNSLATLGGKDFGNYKNGITGTSNEIMYKTSKNLNMFAMQSLEEKLIETHISTDANRGEQFTKFIEKMEEVTNNSGIVKKWYTENVDRIEDQTGLKAIQFDLHQGEDFGQTINIQAGFLDMSSGQQQQQSQQQPPHEYEYTADDEKSLLINRLRALYLQRALNPNMRTHLKTEFKMRKLKNGLLRLGVYTDVLNQTIHDEAKDVAKERSIEMLKEALLERASLFTLEGNTYKVIEQKIKGIIRNASAFGFNLTSSDFNKLRDESNRAMFSITKKEYILIEIRIADEPVPTVVLRYRELKKLMDRLKAETNIQEDYPVNDYLENITMTQET